MCHRVHVRIDKRRSLGEEGRQHRTEWRQQVLVTTYPDESHDGIGRPGDEPQRNHTEDDSGQLQLLLRLVLVRLDAVRRDDHVQDVGVAVGNGDKGNTPGEHKVAEHEDAGVPVLRQVVEAAAGEVSLGHVTAEDFQQRHGREEERVAPAEEDHETRLHVRGGPVRIQRVQDHIEPVDGDGGQRGNG